MSHIENVNGVVITDLIAFEAACKRLGVEFHKDQKTFVAFNTGHCDHAVHVPGLRYEMGLTGSPQPNGKVAFQPQLDYYSDGQEIQRRFCAKLATPTYHNVSHADPNYSVSFEKLMDAYSVEVLKAQARKKGYQPIETILPNGKIKLTVTLPN